MGKVIENRKRPFLGTYRGPVLLHASAAKGRFDEASYFDEARAWVRAEFGEGTASRIPGPAEWSQGGIVGRARVDSCLDPMSDQVLAFALHRHGIDTRWWMRDQYGYVLADVAPVVFHSWKGSLGPQDAPESLMNAIGADVQ